MATTKPSKLLRIGKLGSSYGIKGELKIHSYTNPADNILNYQDEWHLLFKDTPRIAKVESLRKHGQGFVAKLDFLDTPEAVKTVVNTEIAIPESLLPKLDHDEYYWKDLVGCDVYNEAGHHFGSVKELMETGANDVMVVKGERRFLIPYTEPTILNVDLEKKSIIVDWQLEWL